jgi:hypothetical protein
MPNSPVEQRIRGWARRYRSEGEETLFLQNIPMTVEKEAMMQWIDSAGYKDKYDFFYLPRCFTTRRCKGYAFVNFVDKATARRFTRELDGFVFSANARFKVTRSLTQGLEENTAMWAQTRLFRVQDPAMLPFVRYLHEMDIRHLGHVGELPLEVPEEGQVPMTSLCPNVIALSQIAAPPDVGFPVAPYNADKGATNLNKLNEELTSEASTVESPADIQTMDSADQNRGSRLHYKNALDWLNEASIDMRRHA